MAHREKLNSIVRGVLLEADDYVMPEDPNQRAKNMGMALGLIALYELGKIALGMFGIGLVGTIVTNMLDNRKFNQIEQIRADQRDGTLTLHVLNKSKYPVRVKTLVGGYCTTSIAGSAPGKSAAFSIMGINDGTIDVHKFFSDMPNPAAIEISVEEAVIAGSDQTLNVAVEQHDDVMIMPYRPGAMQKIRDEAEQSAMKGAHGAFGPNGPDSKEYKKFSAELSKGYLERSFGNAPFVSAHARVLVSDYDGSGNSALFYMPVGFDKNMQHTIVLTDRIARKALRKQERLVRKLKPGEDIPKFAID